jgi:predicted regulator of Ras-like GTPase activity (Roadblock/LC7/MglB family)
MSRAEDLNRILRQLQTGTPEVEASALISDDGLIIASALPQHMDELRIAGMSATLLNLGMRASIELQRGKTQQVLIRGEKGYAVLSSAVDGVSLLVLATQEAKLGLIFLDMRKTISEIAKIL